MKTGLPVILTRQYANHFRPAYQRFTMTWWGLNSGTWQRFEPAQQTHADPSVGEREELSSGDANFASRSFVNSKTRFP